MDLENISARGTIVSLFPFDIVGEFKPGLIPHTFDIAKGDPYTGKLGITHINSVQRRIDMPEDRGGMQYTVVMASELCQALINDYCSSSLEAGESLGPAIFWVPGILTEDDVLSRHKMEIADALNKQIEWFKILVQKADDVWQATRQHQAITNTQRFAATFLRLDREWLTEQEIEKSLSVCPVCTTKVNPKALVCPNCKEVLDPVGLQVYRSKQNQKVS